MSPEHLQELREIFDLVDTDSSETISALEFERLLHLVRVKMNPDEIVVMMREINSTGEVTFQNFVDLMSPSEHMHHSKDQVLAAFRNAIIRPAPQDGYIHSTDVFELLTKFGPESDCFSEDDANAILQRLRTGENKDQDYICYEDIVHEVMTVL